MIEVLVVDDSLTVRMDLAEALEAAGFVALPCATLADARATLAARPVALAILDVRLPDGDGIDFLHELRVDPRYAALPILVLSTEAEVADRVRGLRTGANVYVGKPYDAGLVIARVRQLVAPANTSAMRVLVIDDSATFRESVAAALTDSGYAVAQAASGAEGLRRASEHRPGAIVVDGILPDMTGELVIRRIRLDPALRSIPCLLLTGSDDGTAEIHALDAGADAFARKDADLDVVLARLGAMLRSARPAASDAASTFGPRRVLVVDDSPTFLHAIAGRLQEDGYDVALASSGEQAIELLAVQPVDCVLLDLEMPGLSGTATCQRIKGAAAVRDTPVVVLTSHDTRVAMLDALAAGADDFVGKAVEHDIVTARVVAQIRRKRAADEHRAIRERLLVAEGRAALSEQLARSNAELAAANRGLAFANRELEAFSYSVSHDLRAPLRAIRSFASMLDEDIGATLGDISRDHLQRVLANTARMSELIDALLELSRVSRAEVSCVRVELGAIAAALVDELRAREPARQIDIAIAPNLIVHADPRLVRALLDNLLANAWKFTAERTPARIEVGARDGDHAFYVRDNGAGFDLAHATKLFTPFHRLHGEQFAGTGVGLATVRRIAERHGGRVWADSAVGAGTTIYFTLSGS